MKKFVILISTFLLYFFAVSSFFTLVGLAELVRDLSTLSEEITKIMIFSSSLPLFLFRLPLITLIALMFTWFHLRQKRWRGFALFIIPFTLAFFILWPTFQWTPKKAFFSEAIMTASEAQQEFSTSQFNYDYNLIQKVITEPLILKEIHLFSDEAQNLLFAYKDLGWFYLLPLCFSLLLFGCSFWKWGSLTSWSYMNFMIAVLVFLLFLYISRQLWGFILILTNDYISIPGLQPFLLPILLTMAAFATFILSIPVTKKRSNDGH